VTIAVTFDEDVAVDPAPTITIPGERRQATATGMGDAGDSDARTWSHAFMVHAMDGGAALEFSIAATDTAPAPNTASGAAAITQESVTSGASTAIDATPPALASGGAVDALHTRARHAGSSSGTTGSVGTGGQLLVHVAASEPLAVTPGDLVLYGTSGAGAITASRASDEGGNAYTYARTVAASDPNGPVEFSLTIRDRAGNSLELDEDDLTTGRGASAGHRITVDTVSPTATAAFEGNAIVVTFSEGVYGMPDALGVMPPSQSPLSLAAAHNDGESTARITVTQPVAVGTWTVAVPEGVTDQARNPRATATVTAERTAAPTATAISYTVLPPAGTVARAAPFEGHAREGDRIALSITLSEAVSTPPTALFVGKASEADRVTMAAGAGANEWAAAYSVEPATDVPGIDGQFAFSATVTGNTGSMGTITASDSAATPPVIDRVAPTLSSVAFSEADTITVTLSERMAHGAAVIQRYAYTVTAPDGTNTPDDDDSSPDTIRLSSTTGPAYAEQATTSTITLTLEAGATDGVTYTVGLPSELVDTAGNALAGHAGDATYDPPAASALEFTIRAGGPGPTIPKSGEHSRLAGIGDTVRISLDLDASVPFPPTITLPGRGVEGVAMGDAGDSDASTWRHDHVVLEAHASTSQASPLALEILAASAAGSIARITPTDGLAAGAEVTLPEIDTVRPGLASAGDALYMRTTNAAFGTGMQERLPANSEATLHVHVVPDEPLVAGAGDLLLFASRTPTDSVKSAAGNALEYAYGVKPGDPEGPVSFELALRDRAGNSVTLTEAGLTAGRGDGSGHRAAVDLTPPRAASAQTATTTSSVVELDGPLRAGLATSAADWAVAGATTTAATIAANRASITLEYDEVEDTAFAPRISYTAPQGGGLGDDAHNALAGLPILADDRQGPAVASAFFETASRYVIMFSEPVEPPPATEWAVTGGLSVEGIKSLDAGSTLALALSPAAVEGIEYTVDVPASLRDRAEPPNMIAGARSLTQVYEDNVSFAARTASSARTLVTFDDSVTGVTVPSEWTVDGTPATSFEVSASESAAPEPVASMDLSAPMYPARTFALLHEDLGRTDARPSISYEPSGADGTSVLLDEFGRGVRATGITASDGAPPLFSSRTVSASEIAVEFSEDVRAIGAPDASRWAYAADAAVAGWPDTVSADGTFSSASLSGRTLTLRLGGERPSSGFGSGDTSATPAVAYLVPDSAEPDMEDTRGNALTHATRTISADGAPPRASTLELEVLDGGVAGAAKSGDGATHARAGDAVRVMLSLTEDAAALTPPSIRALGSGLDMAGAGSQWSAAVAILSGSAEDGFGFTITATDASAAANTARLTEGDLTGPGVTVDTTPPMVASAAQISPDAMQITFSEAVYGEGGAWRAVSGGAEVATGVATPAAPGMRAMRAPLVAGEFTLEFTGLADRAGNALVASAHSLDEGGELRAPELIVVPNSRPLTVIAPGEGDAPGAEVSLDIAGLDGGDNSSSDTFPSEITARVRGAELVIPAMTQMTDSGASDEETILVRRVDHRAGVEYEAAPGADASERASHEAAARAISSSPPAILVELGKPGEAEPMTFSGAVMVRLGGAASSAHVFYLSGAEARTVHSIPECERGTTASDPPSSIGDGAVRLQECRVVDGSDIVVWTNHFTQFGGSSQAMRPPGGSGCDDCTPPTLGVDSTGTRRVNGGFSYNGDVTDASYYYTPLPLITVETGEENVAVLKVFEDSGPGNVRHVGLAFGLSRGQHFAESKAEIRVDIPFSGSHTVSADDPGGSLDADSLRAEVGAGKCMEGSEVECRIVTIYHTFLEPLEFNVVSTIVWDDRRNSWQNFFNHGIEVTGDSLNPSRGIPVNGGTLVLYPLIGGHADEDGDGIYDYDKRHITYMLDAEHRVYRLSPDGTYRPVRNLAALHHDVDDSMYDESRETMHGASRGTVAFEELVAEERRLAEELIAAMDFGHGEAAGRPGGQTSSEPAPRTDVRQLEEAIAREAEIAERLYQELYPDVERPGEPQRQSGTLSSEPPDRAKYLVRLQEAIANEINMAEMLMREAHPEMFERATNSP